MGTGTKRKKKDQPLIKIPQNIQMVVNTNHDNVQAADICIISFDEKVTSGDLIMEGAAVDLLKDGAKIIVTLHNKPIGTLSVKHAEMVKKCEAIGIKYKGTIVTEREVKCARFFRIAQ